VDLFVASALASRPNRLFANNGTGFFTEQGAARGVAANSASTVVNAVTVGDVDNNGNPPPTQEAARGCARSLVGPRIFATCRVCGDLSCSGAPDVLMTTSAGNRLFVNNGSGTS
jgi:hypothetical protein